MRMKAETIVALKKSIKHWNEICKLIKMNLGVNYFKTTGGNGVTIKSKLVFRYGANQCALCTLHNKDSDCKACPVKRKTRNTGCCDSPWSTFAARISNSSQLQQKHLHAAEIERAFLKSLLPKAAA